MSTELLINLRNRGWKMQRWEILRERNFEFVAWLFVADIETNKLSIANRIYVYK